MEDDLPSIDVCPDDVLESVHLLPDRPKSLIEGKFKTYFAVNYQGVNKNDLFVSLLPNQVCIVGLAPTHFLIKSKSERDCERYDLMTETAATAQTCQHMLNEDRHIDKEIQQSKEAVAPFSTVVPEIHDSAETMRHYMDAEGDSRISCDTEVPREEGMRPQLADKMVQQAEPISLSFEVSKEGRSHIKESGRSGKRPSSHDTNLKAGSTLCVVEDANHKRIPSPISGKLLEVNTRLLSDITVLSKKPCREGYLAIMYPTTSEIKAFQGSLMSLDTYLETYGLRVEDLV
ncbi:hypothetical protein CEUSTIGMA_g7263.t1 [Chlamydomonas eustigma]|uniref:Protein Abitram n=1 Tax=Chlamydomonas eustigma TaxID=1157962 RepID=A0A250X9N6_9CHLO|nr:hypothetical protein CEUSTIGMA_g7263.t1 [Chlamydomonas eustigma]|eukprot:GAX79823.1 hypothetical protein CEUSTIGMA_g7263.t1 [Chlamydomonas eustigma]